MTKKLKLSFVSLLMFALMPTNMALAADPTSRDVDALLAVQEPIWVHLNGCPVDSAVPPVIVNSRTFIELNTIFRALEIIPSWDGVNRKVTGRAADGTVIELFIGRRDAYVNGARVWLDASPFIATPYNRTMIPLSFVATATGASVEWIGKPRTVDITTNRNRVCVLQSLHLMSEYMWRGYYAFGEAGPIRLVRGTLQDNGTTRTAYLIGLSGTDLPNVNDGGNATGILEDLIVGGWGGDNDYLRAVRNTLSRNVPAGSNLIFAGHSLGGMIAQQAAADSWIKSNYNVVNTVTVGSPLISAGQREGEVRRMGDRADIVPYLSVLGTILQPWQVIGLNIESGGYFNPVRAHVESYRRRAVWGSYDALGRKGGSGIFSFSSSSARSFPAPRL